MFIVNTLWEFFSILNQVYFLTAILVQLLLLILVQVYIVIRLSQISSCRQSFRAQRATMAELKCFGNCNDPQTATHIFRAGRDEVDA